MKPKGLIVAVVLLAVLGGLVWWSNKTQAAKEKAPSTTTPKIVSIPDDQVQAVRIAKNNGETVEMRKDNGKWTLTQPTALPADPDTAGSLVTTLSSVTADNVVEDKATDLSAYGLAKPQLDVTVTTRVDELEKVELVAFRQRLGKLEISR